MPEEFRGWIRRHFNVVLSFLTGITFGILIFAIAYFSTRNDIAADALRYGVRVTGHSDIVEDVAWLFCGIVLGASVTCLAWWRDSKAKSVGLEQGDVLNRLFTDPSPRFGRVPERSRQDADA